MTTMSNETREDIQRLQENALKEQTRISVRMQNAVIADDEKRRLEMERRIEVEADEAAERAREEVRERYRKENPREWNDNKETKAFRGLVQTLQKG